MLFSEVVWLCPLVSGVLDEEFPVPSQRLGV
jgi:hypothetical protein